VRRRRTALTAQYPGRLRLAKAFKVIVDRLEAGQDIETGGVDDDGNRLAWRSLDVDAYLATVDADATAA